MAKTKKDSKKDKKSTGSKKGTPRGESKAKAESKPEEAPVAAPPVPTEPQCAYHMKTLTYFCENADEPICYDCTIMGPYNTQLHRITSIPDAYENRFSLVAQAVDQTLIPKRSQLVAQITRVDYRIEEIKTVKGIIERDIKNEYGGILERLNSAQGTKLAILLNDLSEIQKDVNRIDDILRTLDELANPTNMPGAPPLTKSSSGQTQQVQFLLRYKRLQEEIDYSITKQFKVDIKVIPNDLPRELAERRLETEEFQKSKNLLKMKDDMIFKLLDEKKRKDTFLTHQMDKETKKELDNWVSLVDSFAVELKKYQLICSFCGVHLDDIAVNTDCPKNPSITDVRDFVPPTHFYASTIPTKEFYANGRHFFVRPDEEMAEQDGNQSVLILNEEILRENPYAASAV